MTAAKRVPEVGEREKLKRTSGLEGSWRKTGKEGPRSRVVRQKKPLTEYVGILKCREAKQA